MYRNTSLPVQPQVSAVAMKLAKLDYASGTRVPLGRFICRDATTTQGRVASLNDTVVYINWEDTANGDCTQTINNPADSTSQPTYMSTGGLTGIVGNSEQYKIDNTSDIWCSGSITTSAEGTYLTVHASTGYMTTAASGAGVLVVGRIESVTTAFVMATFNSTAIRIS